MPGPARARRGLHGPGFYLTSFCEVGGALPAAVCSEARPGVRQSPGPRVLSCPEAQAEPLPHHPAAPTPASQGLPGRGSLPPSVLLWRSHVWLVAVSVQVYIPLCYISPYVYTYISAGVGAAAPAFCTEGLETTAPRAGRGLPRSRPSLVFDV